MGKKLILVMYVSNYLYFPNCNILFQFESFGVVFSFLTKLNLTQMNQIALVPKGSICTGLPEQYVWKIR